MKNLLFLFLFIFLTSVAFAQQIPDLDAIDAAAGADLLYIVDVSDTTDRAEGTGKKATITQVQTAVVHGNGANCSSGNSPLGVDADGAVEGCYDVWTESENTSAAYISATLTEEEVEDFVGGMLGGTETRVSVTYQDSTGDIDFVVDDMNDDVPDAGDFGAATDLDSNGALNTDSVADNEIDYTNVTGVDLTLDDIDSNIVTTANIGIGTASPAAELDVAGNIAISGVVCGDDEILKMNGATMGCEADAGSSGGGFNWKLKPEQAKLPASNPMSINGGGNQWSGLFDDTTDECARWQTVLTPYTGPLKIELSYSLETGSSSDVVSMEVYVMCVSDGDAADVDTDSFGTVDDLTSASQSITAGHLKVLSDASLNGDSCAEDDLIIVKICRDADDLDTTTDDVEFRGAVIYE